MSSGRWPTSLSIQRLSGRLWGRSSGSRTSSAWTSGANVRDTGQLRGSRIATPSVDVDLMLWVGVLMLFGMVMIYSATIALPDANRFASYKPTHFLTRHIIAMVIGVAAALLVFRIPTPQWQRSAMMLFGIGIVLLALVLIPGIGKAVYGARRWIPLGVMNLQPSELMKLFVVLYAADFVVRKQAFMHTLVKGFSSLALAMIVVVLLLLLEPDLGAAGVVVVIAFAVLLLGGWNLIWFGLLSVLLSILFSAVIFFSDWRRERILAYLDPFDEANVVGKGYQLAQSLMAFGRGEVFGVGLGGSVGKLHYLPEAHTDFLLAVIGEELGLIGVTVVIFLFYKITRRIFEIGRQAIAVQTTYAGLVAMGIGTWFGFQAFFNMGVNLGVLPTKGLTLPFMSYGGSALLCNCIALGIVLRIDYDNKRRMRGSPE